MSPAATSAMAISDESAVINTFRREIFTRGALVVNT